MHCTKHNLVIHAEFRNHWMVNLYGVLFYHVFIYLSGRECQNYSKCGVRRLIKGTSPLLEALLTTSCGCGSDVYATSDLFLTYFSTDIMGLPRPEMPIGALQSNGHECFPFSSYHRLLHYEGSSPEFQYSWD